MTLELRPARTDDAATLRRWDALPHVIAATGTSDREDWDTELAIARDWRAWLIAEVDGRPLGFIRIIDPAREESHYWGEVPDDLRAIDIWIGEANMLGRGYGTAMMTEALIRCFAPPEVTAVLIDPLERNVRARRFYARLGFREVGPRRFGEDDCMVYRLDRADWAARRGLQT